MRIVVACDAVGSYPSGGSGRPRRALAAVGAWASTVAAALVLVCAAHAAAAVPTEAERHPLELEALSDPKGALAKILPEIERARADGRQRELALLEIARANACRIFADWECQLKAGIEARKAADAAGEPLLAVRGLIAESRALLSQQQYSPGGRVLAEAERRLERDPSPVLSAGVQLGYSSMSNLLGRHELARSYANRGLQALGDIPEPLIRARLLRNRSRAEANLGQWDAARETVREAIAVAASLNDPKLTAELDLELANIARDQGDVATQRASAERVIDLARRFGHSQLRGLGNEVLGQVARDRGDLPAAETAFEEATEQFRLAGLDAEERRVLRELIRVRLAIRPERNDLGTQTLRLLQLDEIVDARDRALVGEDFEARLRYAEQEFDLQRLAKEAELATERERALTASNRLRLLLIVAVAGGLCLIAVFLYRQRRSNLSLQRSEAALAASRERLRTITDNVPAVVAHVDREERYTFANGYMQRLFGRTEAEIVGRTLGEIHGAAVYPRIAAPAKGALSGVASSFELTQSLPGGDFHFECSYIPEQARDGSAAGFFVLSFDITRLKLAEAQLEREARFDPLTGVANRRQFEERLGLAIARGRHQPVALALLFLDLDFLKPINDRHGHAAGDHLIRAFAERQSAVVREGDLVARIGGDEFVILSEHVDLVQAREFAESTARRMIEAMAVPVMFGESALRTGTSIGIATAGSPEHALALIAAADEALYAAKAAGRNTWRHAA